uniref:Uncharacterized protein n=1 Tax=Timema cristinae TaxID=61476 RepID=A0A7R9HEL5_TIMCR|nr:unnamed protein product [Timema cristinae]
MKWYVSADARFCGCLRTIVNTILYSWCGQTARGTTRNNKFDDAAVWSKNVDHTEKIINDDWAREMKMDASETQPFITQLDNNESDSDEEEVLAVQGADNLKS